MKYVYKGYCPELDKIIYGFPIEYKSGMIKLVIPKCRKDLMEKSEVIYGTYLVHKNTIAKA